MTDAATSSESKLRMAFAAARPHKQIADAEAFLNDLRDLSLSGTRPAPDALRSGTELLDSLERQTEVYLYQAAVLAGREADSEHELAHKVESLGREAEDVEKTTRQLRRALQQLA